MNLAALTAGVDRPLGTAEETLRLYDYLMRFIEGATLAHYTGDRDAKRAEVADKLAPIRRRVPDAVARRAARRCSTAGDELPPDVLVDPARQRGQAAAPPRRGRARDRLLPAGRRAHLGHRVHAGQLTTSSSGSPPTPRTPTASHTTGCSCSAAPTRRSACSRRHRSPCAGRSTTSTLRTGTHIPQGRQGRDRPAVGQPRPVRCSATTPTTFNPHRTVPDGVAPVRPVVRLGHARVHRPGPRRRARPADRRRRRRDHLFGLVPEAVQALFDHGARPDPDDPPEMDASTTRPYFGRYPVLLGRA